MADPIKTPTDLPRQELMELASETLKNYPGAVIHFKFTCPQCGQRCTLEEPNTLYENGICFQCGANSPIERGGFMIAIEASKGPMEAA